MGIPPGSPTIIRWRCLPPCTWHGPSITHNQVRTIVLTSFDNSIKWFNEHVNHMSILELQNWQSMLASLQLAVAPRAQVRAVYNNILMVKYDKIILDESTSQDAKHYVSIFTQQTSVDKASTAAGKAFSGLHDVRFTRFWRSAKGALCWETCPWIFLVPLPYLCHQHHTRPCRSCRGSLSDVTCSFNAPAKSTWFCAW